MHTFRKTVLLFLAGLILLYPQNSHAVSCSPDSGGAYTVSSSCTFPYTVDGVENGNMMVQGGTTLTVNAGQTLIYNPGYSVAVNGTIALNATGQMKQGYIYIKDADSDGYPDDTTTFATTQVDGTYRRRYLMSSISGNDCSVTTAAFQTISVIADADQDGYGTGGSGNTCVGGSSVVSGRTYYLNGATSASTYLASGQNLGTDCNDASATAWRNRYADADGDTYGVSSATCVGNNAGYVDNSTDCNDASASTFQNRTCYLDNDSDTYGSTASGPYTICSGTSCSSGYVADGTDCSDSNAYIYQNVSVYTDSDQDGYVSAGPASTCVGSTSAVGGRTYYKNSSGGYTLIASTSGSDCYDSNNLAYPGSTYTNNSHRGDGSYDYNCDGSQTIPSYYNCTTTLAAPGTCYASKPSGITGWVTSIPSSCGASGTFRYCWARAQTSCGGGGYHGNCAVCFDLSTSSNIYGYSWDLQDQAIGQYCQ